VGIMRVFAGEYVAANSALEEVYGVLRHGYADVIEPDRRNDSKHDRKNYDDDDDDEGDVWRILDVIRSGSVQPGDGAADAAAAVQTTSGRRRRGNDDRRSLFHGVAGRAALARAPVEDGRVPLQRRPAVGEAPAARPARRQRPCVDTAAAAERGDVDECSRTR